MIEFNLNNNVAGHASCRNLKKAFTMAEVLITLGIIGIIAAMTLPTLVQKYNTHIVEVRMKKFYTIMNQAILLAKNKHGDFEGWTYWITEEKDEDGNYINKSDETDKAVQLYLAPFLNILYKKEIVDGNGQKRYLYELSDGSAFSFQAYQNREIIFFPSRAEKCLEMKKAESFGVCAFAFQFYPLSNDNLWKYLYRKGMEPYLHAWNGKDESLYEGETYSCSGNLPNYCTAIIARNGWKVPKDYPRKIRW